MFELLGSDDDDTRILLNRAVGYSIPIPGRPRLAPITGGRPAYHAIVKMSGHPIELGFRIDELPAGMDAGALAIALATAYATNRATAPADPAPVKGDALARSASAGASCLYTLLDPVGALSGERIMEQLEVTIRTRDGGL